MNASTKRTDEMSFLSECDQVPVKIQKTQTKKVKLT